MAIIPPTLQFDDMTSATDFPTVTNAPVYIVGPQGRKAVRFESTFGADQSITVASQIFTTGAVFSLAFWVRSHSPFNVDTVMSELGGSGEGIRWPINSAGAANISIRLQDDGSNYINSSSGFILTEDVWFRVVLVGRSTTDLDIYVDGAEVSYANDSVVTGTGWSGFTSSTGKLNLGHDEMDFSGIKAWTTTALTSQDISDDYDAEIALDFPRFADKTYKDFSDTGEWPNTSGSPNFVADHLTNPGLAFESTDGSPATIDTGAQRFTFGVSKGLSFMIQAKQEWNDTRDILSELGSSGEGLHIDANSTSGGDSAIEVFARDSASNLIKSFTTFTFAEDAWTHVFINLKDENTLDIWIDGVEDSYRTFHSETGGTGFTGFTSSTGVFKWGNANFFLAQVKFWDVGVEDFTIVEEAARAILTNPIGSYNSIVQR